jgi:hypothetical protein
LIGDEFQPQNIAEIATCITRLPHALDAADHDRSMTGELRVHFDLIPHPIAARYA